MRKNPRRRNDPVIEQLILLQLAVFSLSVVACLRWLSLNRLVRMLSLSAEYSFLRWFPLLQERWDWGQMLSFTDRAARFARGEDRCLVRSLILLWLLKARREPAELVIGVRKEAAEINSHAWVESRGTVIGETATVVRHFATMLRL